MIARIWLSIFALLLLLSCSVPQAQVLTGKAALKSELKKPVYAAMTSSEAKAHLENTLTSKPIDIDKSAVVFYLISISKWSAIWRSYQSPSGVDSAVNAVSALIIDPGIKLLTSDPSVQFVYDGVVTSLQVDGLITSAEETVLKGLYMSMLNILEQINYGKNTVSLSAINRARN